MKYALFNVAAILIAAFGTYQFQEYKWTTIVQEQQIEASQKLQAATDAMVEKEREWRKQVNQLESQYHESTRELSTLDRKYRNLVRSSGGLRDKGSGNRRGDSQSTSGNSTCNNATDPAILSRETTDFLLNLTAEADRMREQLRICQEWAKSLSANQ